MTPTRATRLKVERRLGGPAVTDADWRVAGGGLSDATTWRVHNGAADLAVRAEPVPPNGADAGRVAWMCGLLARVRASCPWIAAPASIGVIDGFAWQSAGWRPGEPATAVDLECVAASLAVFHAACATHEPPTRGLSPGLQARAAGLQAHAGDALAWPVTSRAIGEAINRGIASAVPRLTGHLARLAAVPIALQPIHGDARPEHFLITKSADAPVAVTGLIDFGAMRCDTPLIDVARAAGELARGDAERFDRFLAAYGDAAGAVVDRHLVALIDVSAAVVAARRWSGWLADGRATAWSDDLVAERLAAIADRLELMDRADWTVR